MSAAKDILVVGAGPVGALFATVMARRGHRVTLIERRSDMRDRDLERGRSINLALSDRGFKAIDIVGGRDEVMEDAIAMRGRKVHAVDGIETFQKYGEGNQAIFSVSRGGLNRTLLDVAGRDDSITLLFDHKCVDVDFNKGGRPSATFIDGDGKAVVKEADYIFGADGAGSAVRHAMLATERFSYAIEWLEHGYKELTIPAGKGGSFLVDKEALHIWPRGSYMLIALPNPDGSFTCTLFLPFESSQDDVPAFDELTTKEAARAFFERDFSDALALMPTFDEDFANNPTSPLGVVRCHPWHRNANVCLLGDAAHAIVPFYGQGLNAGFEDVTVFASILDEEKGDIGHAIERFSLERKHDGDAIAELALYNFVEMRDRVGDARFILQKKIERKISEHYGDKYTPLYSMVTFSHRPYREALAYGRAQETLMRDILAIPHVEERWDTSAFWPEIEKRVDAFLAHRH